MLQTKTVPLLEAKVADAGAGMLEGYASNFGGEPDSYGDIIEAGAYAETIPEFLKDGFIAWGHDWDEPVATPTQVREDSRGLFITAEFHTHDDAQRARQITAERIERGKSMGLSIGYEPIESEMRQVETPYRNRWGELTDKVRALTKIKLFEVSLVLVPAQATARVTDAKGHHLAYEDHSEHVRVAVREWLERSKVGSALRLKEGRAISESRRRRMADVRDSLVTAIDEIEGLLKETAPPEKVDVQRLRFDLDRTLARVHRAYGVSA